MRYCLALDLQPDPALIAGYEDWHTKVWPEIKQSLYESGIFDMEIYRVENRLFMIMETAPEFTFENKAALDDSNEMVQKWETMMSQFQLPIPGGKPGEKWRLMDRIFSLTQSK